MTIRTKSRQVYCGVVEDEGGGQWLAAGVDVEVDPLDDGCVGRCQRFGAPRVPIQMSRASVLSSGLGGAVPGVDPEIEAGEVGGVGFKG